MEENEASIPGLWTNFTETTGFHGLNKMKFDKKYPGQLIRSVCWAVVWLASAAVLIYIITTELINYYSYPWVSTTYIRLEQEAQFPVVTLSVCDGNTLDLNFTSFVFDDDFVNISDVPVIEYTDFTTYDMVDIGKCNNRRFNANGKLLTDQHGRHNNLLIKTRAKEIQIAVHPPREEPDMYEDSITVGQDTYSFKEVHRREYIFLPSPFISFGNQMCQENYDYFDCDRKCWNELLKKQCGCTMNRSGNGTHCVDTPADKACSDKLETKESSAICEAACLPECKFIKYDVIVSSRVSK
ncbi:acid-sensing ion channel 5-like [Mytilus trossulus]|uniref:acid-sensing ion channel 5-like n=1 Tax=Mytilus trossulus TaxID=6551 RepID=UPI003006E875